MKRIESATFVTACLLLCTPVSVMAQNQRISSDHFFGCKSREYFEKLVSFSSQKDMVAFKKGLGAGFMSGQCIPFKAGEPVFLADTALFAGLVKLRRRGDVSDYWTVSNAIK